MERWTETQIEQLAMNLQVEEEPVEGQRWETTEQIAARKAAAFAAFQMRMEGAAKPSWLDDYMMLRQTGWPWEVAIYVAWAAQPKAKRMPKSADELAKQFLGLSGDRQIYVWRRKNPAILETIAMLQAAPLLEHRADIFAALVESASNPDYRHAPDRRLALEMTGDYVPSSKIEATLKGKPRDLSELSDAELDVLAGQALREIEAEERAE